MQYDVSEIVAYSLLFFISFFEDRNKESPLWKIKQLSAVLEKFVVNV